MEATARFQLGLRDAAHRYGLAAFWRWWVARLGELVPAAPRTALRRLRLRPVLGFEPDAAVLLVPRVVDGALRFVAQARIPTVGEPAAVQQAGRAALEALARERGGRFSGRVRIALPRARVLRKEVTLPAAIEQDLRSALAYDLDRHTPFPADQLYFDAVVVGRDAQRREIRVEWAAVQRAHVDQALRLAESWGALVVGVQPEMPAAGVVAATDGPRLDLLPGEAKPESGGRQRWQQWLAPVVLALVAVVALALPLWQKRELALTLAQVTEQARVQATAADAVRAEFEQTANDYNFVLERKYAYPAAVQLLEDVTRLLPDDTWILQFELKSSVRGKEAHRDMFLRGESANAGRLVSLLEESKLFEQASPRSPMTKIQPGPGEIFDVGAQLKPLAPPSKIELALSATAAPAPSAPPGGAAPAPAAAPSAPAGPAAAAAPTASPSVATPAASATAATPTATGTPAGSAATAGTPAPVAGPVPAPAPAPARPADVASPRPVPPLPPVANSPTASAPRLPVMSMPAGSAEAPPPGAPGAKQ